MAAMCAIRLIPHLTLSTSWRLCCGDNAAVRCRSSDAAVCLCPWFSSQIRGVSKNRCCRTTARTLSNLDSWPISRILSTLQLEQSIALRGDKFLKKYSSSDNYLCDLIPYWLNEWLTYWLISIHEEHQRKLLMAGNDLQWVPTRCEDNR